MSSLPTIEIKGELCNYCNNRAEFIKINEEMPLCFQCIHDGKDV